MPKDLLFDTLMIIHAFRRNIFYDSFGLSFKSIHKDSFFLFKWINLFGFKNFGETLYNILVLSLSPSCWNFWFPPVLQNLRVTKLACFLFLMTNNSYIFIPMACLNNDFHFHVHFNDVQ